MHYLSDEVSNMYECRECGTWWLDPRLDQESMIAYYKDDGYFSGSEGGYDNYDDQEISLRKTFSRLISNIKSEKGESATKGSLFEIGCATGNLLVAAGDDFKHKYGTDYSEKALSIASEYADKCFLGGIDEIPEQFMAEQNVSLVISTNVIEHIHDPLGFLRQIKNIMPEGAYLCLTTPDAGSWWHKVLGKHWPSIIVPEHIFYFTQNSLNLLLKKAGFSDVQTIKNPQIYSVETILKKLKFPDWLSSQFKHVEIKFKSVMAASIARKM